MNLASIAGTGLVAAAAAVLLQQYRPEYAMLVSLTAVGLLFGWTLTEAVPVLHTIQGMMNKTSAAGEAIRILIKCLGICYLCEIGGQICREAGQGAIASKIELAGRLSILILCLPLFEQILQIALTLIHL